MKRKSWTLKLGVVLIIVCIPFFLTIPVVPFLSLEAKAKVTLTTALLIAGEVLFWGGGLLVGKELFAKYKSYFNPRNWRKKSE